MELICRTPRRYHVSHDTVAEFERAILADARVVCARPRPLIGSVIGESTRFLARAGIDTGRLLGAHRTATATGSARDYFAVMMNLDPTPAAPWFARASRRSVYLFDAWPAHHASIKRYVESWGIRNAFISSSAAAHQLASGSRHCNFAWVPEGVDPESYRHRPPAERDIDVLQLGRKLDAHHVVIAPALKAAGRRYEYERQKGQLVFESREAFVDGLSRSRISICVPSSVTHPERAGDVETMTTRYLQSMASGCLVLGKAPAEMIELFGYNPVIEIDMNDPAGQIIGLLDEYELHLPLIEKNRDHVLRDHTWRNRWEQVAAVLLSN
ncbi:MAG: glycosyltransferase [Gemmatimonadaceae bacterium]